MTTSGALRKDIETALYRRAPAALSPRVERIRERLETGINPVDRVVWGGFQMGAVTEVQGAEGSGRTTVLASFVARRLREGQVFAWVDAGDALDPESMAMGGVDVGRLLWVRCGKPRGQVVEEKHVSAGVGAAIVDEGRSAPALGGGCGSPHPRGEGRGLPQAIGGLMGGFATEGVQTPGGEHPDRNRALLPERRREKGIGTPGMANRPVAGTGSQVVASKLHWRSKDREEQVATDRLPGRRWEPRCAEGAGESRILRIDSGEKRRAFAWKERGGTTEKRGGRVGAGTPQIQQTLGAIDQALRATDIILQGGGFGVVVLDLGGVEAEVVSRIPMATWFRFRAAAERTQVCFVLLTQYACARSSASLVLEMSPGVMESEGRVMTGVRYGAKVGRQRFGGVVEPEKVVGIRERGEAGRVEGSDGEGQGRRRPPQPDRAGGWRGQAAWTKANGVADVRTAAGAAGMRRRKGRKR